MDSRKNSNEDEIDRPLKKAKYLWQVKGKYHLKDNQTSSSTSTISINENKKETPSSTTERKTTKPTATTTVCNDRSCIEAIIANSDKYMEFSSLIDKNIDKSISDEIPITLVKQTAQTDDFYLRKWQARQIAKGFLDNTINRVLEHWMVAPFDAADFVENCDNGGQVEDEGILMAIQSHGLQSGMGMGMMGMRMRPASLFHCNTRNGNWEAQANCTCTSNVHPERETKENNHLMPFHHRTESNLNDFHLSYYEDKPPPSLLELQTVVDDRQTTHSSYEPLKMNDTDFLDAAVAVAIQKKGLTSLNCVDCG